MKNTNLHNQVLSKEALNLLEDISVNPEFSNFYLAGGTALSLQLGHRESIDLDFFTHINFKSNLIDFFPHKYETISIHNNSIEIISNGVKILFLYFGFPLNQKLNKYNNFRLAHPIDIGLMKLMALQGRSMKKDIVDLFVIHENIMKLGDLLKLFDEFYPKEKVNGYDSLKFLLDIDELELQPDPILFNGYSWEVSLNTVVEEIKNYVFCTIKQS